MHKSRNLTWSFRSRLAGMAPLFFLALTGYAPLLGARSLDFTPPRPEGPAKIQSSLWDLAATGQAAAKPADAATGMAVVVTLVPYPGKGSASIDTSSFAELGVNLLARSQSLMRVSVPASSLVAVSEIPGVGFVRKPIRPHAQQETWSEGGWLIGAYDNLFAGVTGQGSKVAIIDDGFKGANELPGDMPGFRWVDFTGEGIYVGESVHGTACAEIVHDMARAAELYLYKVGDMLDFENAKDRCIADGVHIVSHSFSWPVSGFGDGRGIACDIVNEAASSGILWVNSAGNSAERHYSGFWSDPDFDGWHNFRGEFEVLPFEAEEGDEIRAGLTWDDWPVTSENYDMIIYFDDPPGDLERVAEGTDIQSGAFPNRPREFIEFTAPKSGKYGITVRSQDAEPLQLKVWLLSHDLREGYSTSSNSIEAPADARGSMSVGAVDHRYWDSGLVEEYSSRGPTTDGRIKPELVAPTGVSTVSYGKVDIAKGIGYWGTSAAAPHVAGAAALIKSANPSFSRDDLWNAIIAATVDIDVFGRDNNSGYGKLVLPVLQTQEDESPRITSVDPQRVQYGQTISIHGTGFGPSRGNGKVIFHEDIQHQYSSQFVHWSDTRIQVQVPIGAQSGPLQVITDSGSDTIELTVTSPWVDNISLQRRSTDILVTVNGANFGSTRGNSSVTVGSRRIEWFYFSSWTGSRIRFSIPHNTRSSDLRVRTSEGTSNPVLLELPGPYLRQVSPNSLHPGDRLTLSGSFFNHQRGNGYVLFHPNVRPSSSDYVSWSDGRIIVEVPSRSQSGDVKVVTLNGSSGARRIEVEKVVQPRITSVSPNRVRYNQVMTIRGTGFGDTRGTSKVVFYQGKEPNSSQYVSWSDTRIQVRVPTGARTGNLQVVTARGSDTFRLTITSPWVRTISPRSGRANTLVTVTGSNFGSSRGSSSVRIGSAAIPFSAWSNSRIQFRIPVNSRSGNLSVRTTEGTSNTLFLEVTSPYLSRVFPTRVKPGDQLTLTGGKFRSTRGTGYVLFSPNVRPASGDYVTWSDTRIVVEVPSRAESGNVKVATVFGSSGNRRIEVEQEEVEPLPSRGIFGYNPPSLTKNPKSVKFGFEGIGEDVAMKWTQKNDSEIDILVNGQLYSAVEESDDWQTWWGILNREDLNSGPNVIEFRNKANQNRSSSYTRWQLKDVELWKPFHAKLIAGATFLGSSQPVFETVLGDPFPTPFNAHVTVPFTTADPGQVRISVFNLMGQQVRVLHDGWTEAGAHQAHWDGRTDTGTEAASGLYWALLRTGELAQSTRLVLIR